MKTYDVVIAGGGPGGLSAALALGRARKRVLLCDAGSRRNAAATHIHNFVTRDGTPPDEFRRIAREQLAKYPTVDIRDARIGAIGGVRNAFAASIEGGESVTARRVLLATGMIDEQLAVDGFRELWGHALFQCPYCHGYEVRDQRWGFWVQPGSAGHFLAFALMLRGWTDDVVVFTGGHVDLTPEARAQLDRAGIRVETAPVAKLHGRDRRLESIELASGEQVPRDVLFVHPPQRQVDLVRALGLALDEEGYLRVDAMKRETSVPGIFASGDLASRMQGALFAAAAGTQAAAMITVDLAMDPAP